MKPLIVGIVLGLTMVMGFSMVYAQMSTFEMRGTGAAVLNTENPQIFISSIRMDLPSTSSINQGLVTLSGGSSTVVARFIADQWSFSYANDGSFHGAGPAQTNQHDVYNISLDGSRVYSTSDGSMWKVSATMQETGKNLVLEYLLIGKDPVPTVSVPNTATVLIPNGNSAEASKGFFVPLNLEIIRGTNVIWQNQDNIGHTIQSIDKDGNIIPLFNSGVLGTGDTFNHQFNTPGTYHYYCSIHPWRIGVVTVS